MEAKSLASINYLAANPPQYPVNPAEGKPDPLTLYISRVPGTRDVILSPYKPGLKNVTAQDVASSLYYVHFEHPSTANLANPTDEHTRRHASQDSERHDAIPRKPLPHEPTQVTPERSNEHLPATGMPARKPVPRPISPAGSSNEDQTHPALQPLPEPARVGDLPPPEPKSLITPDLDSVPARRPLGPRPMQADRPLSLVGEKQNVADHQLAGRSHPSSDLPPLPQEGFEVHGGVYVADHEARPRSGNRPDSPVKPLGVPNAPSNPPRTSISEAEAVPVAQQAPTFSLSLIRRDPGTGHQWNVGHVSSEYSDAGIGPLHQPSYPPIDVQIENTGYSKFRNMPLAPSSTGDDAEAMLQALVGRSQEPLSDEIQNMVQEARITASPQGYFNRQVSMAYTKSWTSNIIEKIQKIDKQGWKNSVNNVLQRGRAGSESTVLPVAPSSVPPVQEDSTSGAKMRARGYHFTSPWSTECEFRTGNNGRSVKCFHTIQDSGSYNPLVDEDDDDGEQKSRNGGARLVSELRFNLPSGDIFPSKDNDLAAAGQRMKGHFSKFLRHGSVDSNSESESYYFEDEEDETVSPFDINLGAEKAGGGNRGKRAKLGKLIVHGDGQKMLDLVVAANVGVWWGAWERTV